jgi:hypothetical protein
MGKPTRLHTTAVNTVAPMLRAADLGLIWYGAKRLHGWRCASRTFTHGASKQERKSVVTWERVDPVYLLLSSYAHYGPSLSSYNPYCCHPKNITFILHP